MVWTNPEGLTHARMHNAKMHTGPTYTYYLNEGLKWRLNSLWRIIVPDYFEIYR